MATRAWICAVAIAVTVGASLVAIAPAAAQSAAAVRKQAEASLLVTGTIDLRADGTVVHHALDETAALTPALRDMIATAAAGWRFEPVTLDPGSQIGRARMSLRLVATKQGEDQVAVRIDSASFGRRSVGADRPWNELDEAERARWKRDMAPPRYPQAALRAGAGATVYLVLKVAPDGAVQDAVAEQTNLRFVASEPVMARWRRQFEQASVAAAREWRLAPPDAEELREGAFASVRVPVSYFPPGATDVLGRGGWEVYVPGPRTIAPWLLGEPAGNDALVAGETYAVGTGLKLLTPLQPQG